MRVLVVDDHVDSVVISFRATASVPRSRGARGSSNGREAISVRHGHFVPMSRSSTSRCR